MRQTRRGERGQVLILGALLMTSLLGFMAVVIDVGNAYAQRRLMQNASDAAAIAGARLLANSMQSGTTDAAMVGVLNTYLNANGQGSFVPNAALGALDGAWYVDGSGARVRAVGSGYNPPAVPVGGMPAVWGVEVVARKQFDTYFAGVIGFNSLTVRADATARYANVGGLLATPPTGARMLPLIFSLDTFNQSLALCGGYSGSQITFTLDVTNPFSCSGNVGAGGFDWGPVIPSSNPNATVKDLLDPSVSLPGAQANVGDPIQTAPGERAQDYKDLKDNWQGQDVIVPLIADTSGCPNCAPPLAGFAWFHVYTADGSGSPKSITGWWVDPAGMPPLPGRQLGTSSEITGPVTFALTR